MKVLRNILSCIYLAATVCSLMFFANMWEFPLTIGAGSWIYALVIMMLSEELSAWVGLLGAVWFISFWVLLVISAILAYKGKFMLLCVYSGVDALVTAGYLALRLFWDRDILQAAFIIDGVVSVFFTAAMITATVLCRNKEMQTDVDVFLREQRRGNV